MSFPSLQPHAVLWDWWPQLRAGSLGTVFLLSHSSLALVFSYEVFSICSYPENLRIQMPLFILCCWLFQAKLACNNFIAFVCFSIHQFVIHWTRQRPLPQVSSRWVLLFLGFLWPWCGGTTLFIILEIFITEQRESVRHIVNILRSLFVWLNGSMKFHTKPSWS